MFPRGLGRESTSGLYMLFVSRLLPLPPEIHVFLYVYFHHF